MITVRDGNGDVAYSGPTIFLPEDQTFQSFGVVKAPDARPDPDRARGRVLPDVRLHRRDRTRSRCSATTATRAISMLVYTGDLGMDDGRPQSVYALDKADAERCSTKPDGSPFRVDLQPGETVELPDGARHR